MPVLPAAIRVLPRPVYLAIGAVLTHPWFHPIHSRLYRWSGGRGPLSRALGVDMILVTMRGRRSGVLRTVPLGAVSDGASWVVIGSNAGKARTPAWALNLRAAAEADGSVVVEHRSSRAPFRASEAAGSEAERLWTLVATAYPGYVVYRQRTDRPIALFVLEPVSD